MLADNVGDSYFDAVVQVSAELGAALRLGIFKTLLSTILDRQSARLRGGIRGHPAWNEIADAVTELNRQVVDKPIVEDDADVEQGTRAVRFIQASAKLRLARGSVETIKQIVLSVWPEAGASGDELARRLPTQHLLVHSRVRFDVAMQLTMRAVWMWCSLHEPWCMTFLWADGSPTSGYEAFVVFEQFVGRHRVWQRLLAIGFLGFGFMHLNAIIFALLHKLWIETGTVSLMRWRLKMARALTTDFGTEERIADSGDLLPEFLAHIGWGNAAPVSHTCSHLRFGVAVGTMYGTTLRSGHRDWEPFINPS